MNRRQFSSASVVLLLGGLMACSPTFNWRDVPLGERGLVALLPCKPDRATREVMLAGEPVALEMAGCQAGGALFTVARVEARDAAQAAIWLADWQATLPRKLQDAAPQQSAAVVRGAASEPAPVRVTTRGRDAAGQPAQAQSLWFVQRPDPGAPAPATARSGAWVLYQATVLGQPGEAEASATFFDGLRLP